MAESLHIKLSSQCVRILFLALIGVLILLASTCPAAEKKRILYIDSYSSEYIWSSEIAEGIDSVLSGRSDIELKTFSMDTKRHQSEADKKKAALKAMELIEAWQPDVVIASDDNAAKYLIVPYYRNSNRPFVFCGLNWDASVYGFPSGNVTGMVEVALINDTISALESYSSGERIGYLASDTISERKEYENIVERFGISFETRFVKTFDELKQAYLELQQTTDMVIIQECHSVRDFNHSGMLELVREHTRVPTGAMQNYLRQYALLTFAKSAQEQGAYAAKTALDILGGRDPRTIPVVANRQARIYLNMTLAKRMGIKFPMEWIQAGHLIDAEQKKLLYINSYHAGYSWSDDIEKGLLKALKIKIGPDGSCDDTNSEVMLKIFRMDTKRNGSEEFTTRAVLTAKKLIDEWQPDIIVISDDNAARYLVVPYLKDSPIPVVFCGINWSAADYDFPANHITGMVEVNPILDSIAMLKNYAKGDRLGYIGFKDYTEEKEIEYFSTLLHLSFADGGLVSTYQQWKQLYLKLQNSVDMIVVLDPSSVKGWNAVDAEAFILDKTRIPTVSTGDNASRYTLLGKVKIAEEQGWWAGGAALKILDGTAVKNIPVTTNQHDKLLLNMKLARKLGIKFPLELLEKATLLE